MSFNILLIISKVETHGRASLLLIGEVTEITLSN